MQSGDGAGANHPGRYLMRVRVGWTAEKGVFDDENRRALQRSPVFGYKANVFANRCPGSHWRRMICPRQYLESTFDGHEGHDRGRGGKQSNHGRGLDFREVLGVGRWCL